MSIVIFKMLPWIIVIVGNNYYYKKIRRDNQEFFNSYFARENV